MPQLSKPIFRIKRVPDSDGERALKESGAAALFFRGEAEYREKSLPPELAQYCVKLPESKRKRYDTRIL